MTCAPVLGNLCSLKAKDQRNKQAAGSLVGMQVNLETQPEYPPRDAVVERLLDRLAPLEDRSSASVSEIVNAFGSASFVPFLVIPSLFVISPLSGIPFFSTFCGLTIALVALQMLIGREHLWLPGWLLRKQLSGESLHRALAPSRQIARAIDARIELRWRILNTPPFDKLPGFLCLVAGLSMPFLEVVPFSSSVLGFAVLLFSVGILARDGRFTLAGVIVLGIALAIPYTIYSTIAG